STTLPRAPPPEPSDRVEFIRVGLISPPRGEDEKNRSLLTPRSPSVVGYRREDAEAASDQPVRERALAVRGQPVRAQRVRGRRCRVEQGLQPTRREARRRGAAGAVEGRRTRLD